MPEGIARSLGMGSFVIVPLVSDGRCLGFLTCDQRGEVFSLDEAEVDLLTTFGTLIAAFLERAIEQSELRRLNELKSQFAALASHELRTPAAAIYGAVRTLDEREADLPPEQRGELRRMLTEQSKRLYDIVENLLDLSRLEADSIRIEPTRIDVPERLNAIVEAVFDGADVTVDAPEDLAVMVDAQAFDRIVSNLVSNARRHGAPPIVVSARGVERRAAGDDRGPRAGSRRRVRRKPLRALHARRDRSARAPGLGLSIAQSYARAHGGTLTYEPAEPHGARFRVVLPIGA